MKKYIAVFLKAILAGIIISLGGVLLLTLYKNSKELAAIIFGIGLSLIFVLELDLFTDKVTEIFENKANYIINLVIMLAGNAAGAYCCGKLMLLTSYGYYYNSFAEYITQIKFSNTYLGSFFLALSCGALMYFAHEGFKKAEGYFGKIILVVFCTAVFIICKFEHSILDIFFFTVARSWSLKAVYDIIICLAGNAVGAAGLALFVKIIKYLEGDSKKDSKKKVSGAKKK